ncbi:divergent polysaccharide deacetylase family protein [Paenibacillus cymbidii]|uniref:divergent polysaccharide deacetylase family protein n=1 Tax=Paenibacillus cymbidii TaxID=1639034 RepID=UPI001F1ECC5B|nr:divergent polysaccharide deacetylase family protein [Paenibacillus cymbidii]
MKDDGNGTLLPARSMKRILTLLCVASALLLLNAGATSAEPLPGGQPEPGPAPAPAPAGKMAAIVIDDFGNNLAGTEQMMALPQPITTAIMPFLPTTHRDAEWSHKAGHEVIVHLPMEPKQGRKEWLGPGAITTALSDDEIRKRVGAAIDDVPYAVGINNHMGSRATGDKRVMTIVLEVCKERGLFFLDSRTNYRSVVPEVSSAVGLHTLANQMFLDDIVTHRHVSGQMEKLRKLMEEQDRGIAIGHVGNPGKITSAVLKQTMPELGKQFRFVRLSEMLAADRAKGS